MKNIKLIPTDKPSRLHEYDFLSPMGLSKEPLQWRLGRNIYITSDEVKKNGEWVLSNLNEVVKFCSLYCQNSYKKIILTDDKDLIADGVQAIDDEFLEWFVKNPSCERVEIAYTNYKKGAGLIISSYKTSEDCKYKIIIPKEEPKQETLEEAVENRIKGVNVDTGYRQQNNNLYNEIEVIELLQKALTHQDDGETGSLVTAQGEIRPANFFSWFERFKKK
jgi:hypothetical protein